MDFPDELLAAMDVVIASIHGPCLPKGDKAYYTECILQAMDNPFVNVIGHPDDGRFPLDYLPIVQKAQERNILLEVNNSSLIPNGFRLNAAENYKTMLELCRKYQVPVIVNSDAHFIDRVGRHDYAYQLLEEIQFPEDLVVNLHPDRIHPYLNYYKR